MEKHYYIPSPWKYDEERMCWFALLRVYYRSKDRLPYGCARVEAEHGEGVMVGMTDWTFDARGIDALKALLDQAQQIATTGEVPE